MKYQMSNLAEIYIGEIDDSSFHEWLKNYSTFTHNDSYEFIHHLFLDESEGWYTDIYLTKDVPDNIKELILSARRQGAARICFYV